jgi:hypothetical protein
MTHAVGFEGHDDVEAVAGDALVVGGVIVTGEGVVLAAVGCDDVIRCSRKWAIPEAPRGSSAEPTRYQTIWVTTGARRSVMTTTCMPLRRVKVSGTSNAKAAGAVAKVATRSAAATTIPLMRLPIGCLIMMNAPTSRSCATV